MPSRARISAGSNFVFAVAWPSFMAITPNSDVPVIERRTGRAVYVQVGMGGNPRVDNLIARFGVGEVPDDGRRSLRNP